MPLSDQIQSLRPPAAPEVEKSVLGLSLLHEEALYIALENLTGDDFYVQKNRLVFEAMQQLFFDGKQPSEPIVTQWLRDQGSLEALGLDYFQDLHQSASGLGETEEQCQTLIEKRIRRHFIAGLMPLTQEAYDTATDTGALMEKAAELIFELVHSGSTSNTHEAREYIADALQHLLNIQGSDDGVTGIPTGLDIDKITSGWQDEDFIIIAARPSMGKTALVLQAVKSAARQRGSAGIISLEMGWRSLSSRMIISEAEVDGQRARTGKLSANEITKLEEAADRLMELGVIVDDTTTVTPAILKAKARAMIHKYGIKLLAIDYLQLLTSNKDNREQQVAEISRTAKEIAKEYGIPVLGLSQLSRACEARHGINRRPQLSDLRESGALEQDCDVAMFLFRPEYYGMTNYPDTEDEKWRGKDTRNICELIVGKHRNGPTGMKRVGFDEKTMRFYNLAPEPSYTVEAMTRNRDRDKHAPF